MSYLYFSDKELSCPCGCEGEMDDLFMKKLVAVRQELDKPLVINSAYRCTRYNGSIGGVKNSAHTKGRAVDVSLHNLSEADQIRLIELALSLDIRGLGVNDKYNHFLHLDDTRARLWTY